MPKLKGVSTTINGEEKRIGYVFFCLGCDRHHRIPTQDANDGQRCFWDFNGNMDKPTFTPSIFVHGKGASEVGHECHSFVTDGKIQYLGDCTHHLAGQTIELPEINSSL